jgi:hypothetical protein
VTIRYLDSGSGGPDDCLGQWLDRELCEGVRAFRGQFGFFDISALRQYLTVLQDMVTSGGQFRLVIGANSGDPPSTDDLEALVPLIESGDSSTVTVVGFSNALFHPKVLHLVRPSGVAVAVVGSANLTAKGLGHNVEAGLVIESEDGTDDVLDRIASSIDYWSTCTDSGVHQVASVEDVNQLMDQGLAVPPAVRRRLRKTNNLRGSGTGRGTRAIYWRPPRISDAGDESLEVEGTGESTTFEEESVSSMRGEIISRWCKALPTSDAQQPSAEQRTVRRSRNKPTNVTGNLRLTKSKFDIDQTRYFREIFFGELTWVKVERQSKTYDQAHVQFEVSMNGGQWEPYTVLIDHAPHRVAGQGNVPTVIKWGPELGKWLRQNNKTGNWVVLEKDSANKYWLSIQPDKPDWAP